MNEWKEGGGGKRGGLVDSKVAVLVADVGAILRLVGTGTLSLSKQEANT